MSIEDNKEVVRRFFGAIVQKARGEIDHVRDYCTPDVTFHTALLSTAGDHVDRLHEEIDGWASAMPDVDLEIRDMLAEGDLVAVHLAAGGTHTGTFAHPAGPCEPSGAAVEAGVLELFRLRDGRISDIWFYTSLPEAVRAASTA